MTEYVMCPKCGKDAWQPDYLTLKGKNGQVYKYRRYRHPVKWKRSLVHYERVKD